MGLYASLGFTEHPVPTRADAFGENVHLVLDSGALRVLLRRDTARGLAQQILAALDEETES